MSSRGAPTGRGERTSRGEPAGRTGPAVSSAAPAPHPDERELITPEGLPLRVRIASRLERAGAFLLDLCILFGAFTALCCSGMLVGITGSEELMSVIVLLGVFGLRNFYFLVPELGTRGASFGKRMVRLRVIDARGGPLSSQAVLARNLMREVEFFLPLTLLLFQRPSFPGASPLIVIGGLLWTVLLLVFPLLNRDRQRVGDLVGGTLVVRAPRATLERDAAEVTPSRRGDQPSARFHFTDAQLGHYGIYELQVLEQLVRGFDLAHDGRVPEDVCRRIQRKIDWRQPVERLDVQTFLRDFYAAQRHHLERRMEHGQRKEHKRDNKSDAKPDTRARRRP